MCYLLFVKNLNNCVKVKKRGEKCKNFPNYLFFIPIAILRNGNLMPPKNEFSNLK